VFGNPERLIAAASRQGADLIFDLRSRDDGDDTRMSAGSVRLDAFNPRVRVGTSQNRDMERIRKIDIVHVLAKPTNQSRIFTPLHLSANELTYRHGGFSIFGFFGSWAFNSVETPDLFFRLLSHSLCRLLDCVHDVLIAGAAAEVSVKRVTNLVLCRLRIPQQELVRAKNHPWSAVTALKPVTFPKGLLERMEFLPLSQSLDRQKIGAVSLNRKHRAGLHRSVVEHDSACPADTGLAADVSAR